jgi:hypothetical protein
MKSINENNLPIKRNLKLVYILSLIIASLLVIASICGILFGSVIYPTDELLSTFISNDVVNLLIGLPIIIGSIFLTLRGKLIGLLFWPGALFFVLYNYMIYVLAMPLNWAFLLHLTLTTLSVYTIIILVASIDGIKIQQRLTGVVYERIAGGILVAMGLLFMLQVVGVMIDSLINQIPVTGTELATHVSDFLISPALVIGGILLWRRKEFGYVSGLGLLFQASMLFIGLIVFLIVQPLLTSTPFLLVDVLVVFIMGLICFIPLALFIRGIGVEDNSSSSLKKTEES